MEVRFSSILAVTILVMWGTCRGGYGHINMASDVKKELVGSRTFREYPGGNEGMNRSRFFGTLPRYNSWISHY